MFSVGGNVRRNNFDITIAPDAENRTELGAYVQDEIFLDQVRLTIGGRVDKFGNLSDPVFSPRLAAVFKPVDDHAIRVSFNRAFRSPSVINNYLDISIVVPTDLSALAPLLPPPLQPLVAQPFPLVVKAVGSELPIGTTPQAELTEESLTAYEVAYTGTFGDRTTLGRGVLRQRSRRQHQLRAAADNARSLHGGQPAARLAAAAGDSQRCSRSAASSCRGPAFTYLNLGPLRQKGVELSLDHRVNSSRDGVRQLLVAGEADRARRSDDPYPSQELALPPTHRFNVGFNFDSARLLGSAHGELLGQGVLERRADRARTTASRTRTRW